LLATKPGLTLVISGGDYGREETLNNIGSLDLYQALMRRGWGHQTIKSRIIIESMSQHTGHQRMILGHLFSDSLKPEHIWVILPKYHMPRFIMTIGLNLYERGFKTNIHPQPFGEWQSAHAAKGPLDNPARTFTYEELLTLPQAPSRFEGKLDCGEVDKIIMYAEKHQCLTFRQAREWLC
jgi:hypothetical protein